MQLKKNEKTIFLNPPLYHQCFRWWYSFFTIKQGVSFMNEVIKAENYVKPTTKRLRQTISVYP